MTKKLLQSSVENVIRRIRKDGDRALFQLARQYDKARLTKKTIRIAPQRIKAAYRRLPAHKKKALEACARRIQSFHWYETKNLPQSWTINKSGIRLGQIIKPIESVGIYVPGGRFSYPSTLLMTAIPAGLAGVQRRAVVTPPGRLTDDILAAAHMAGVDELYQVGGPAALAALALGTDSIRKVDLIIGPGNAMVTEAKRQLFGEVGIDMLAGPSELVVIADESAPADFIAADMAAQAEHDPDARSFLVTVSKSLLGTVKRKVPKKISGQCRYYFFSDMKKVLLKANDIAGEHVQVMVRNPKNILDQLKNGGALFINPWSPAVMGDYWAGPSHVLPTGKSARFASGLSVLTFLKRSTLVEISESAFAKGADAARHMAETEGLDFHAASISIRLKRRS